MNLMPKTPAEQKGILLRELLSFLLSMNGKAKKDDVLEHFADKSSRSKIDIGEDEYQDLIETLASMSVKAEWLRRSSNWKVTEHGKQAYERFNSPKDLFQEMAVQFAFRKTAGSQKEKQALKTRAIALSLVSSPCMIIGLASNNQHLFYLVIIAIAVLVLSLIYYDSRTKLIIVGRASMIEFLMLCYTFVLDAIFINTSIGSYFQEYFLVTLAFQATCLAGVFMFPRISSKVFEYINQSKWLIMIPILLLMLLFGGKSGRGGGLIEVLYGDDISAISGTITFAGLMGMALFYILGGIVSNLVRAGYYD